MRALSIAMVFFGVPWITGDAAAPPPIEAPVTISQGTLVRVPFSVTQSGTYDLELQYRAGVETYYNRILDLKLRRELAGAVMLPCDGRTLKHNLPTGWGRALPGRVTTVIIRFWILAALCVALALGLFYADFLSLNTHHPALCCHTSDALIDAWIFGMVAISGSQEASVCVPTS